MELTTKSASLILLVSGAVRCPSTRIPCSLCVQCSMFNCVLVFWHFWANLVTIYSAWDFTIARTQFITVSSLPFFFPLTCSVWRVPAFFSCTMCDGAQGCQDLPAMGVVPFKGLAAHSKAPGYLRHPASTLQWIVNYKWENGGSCCQWRPCMLTSELTVGGMSCCLLLSTT